MYKRQGVKDLTLIVNDTAYPDKGCGRLIAGKQVRKVIVSHIGTNPCTSCLLYTSPDHALPRQHGTPAANLLSVRETEVLTLIAQGLLNKQIADRLQIGLTTVISHRRNIMQKLGVQSVAALVICAVSMGYVDESDIRTPHK